MDASGIINNPPHDYDHKLGYDFGVELSSQQFLGAFKFLGISTGTGFLFNFSLISFLFKDHKILGVV